MQHNYAVYGIITRMRESPQKKVLVCLSMGSPAGSKQLSGIFRYSSVSANWDIVLVRLTDDVTETLRELREGGFSGVISSISSPNMLQAIRDSCTCHVRIDRDDAPGGGNMNPRVGNVRSDDLRAGREGARHLLSLGAMRTYGYIPAQHPGARWTRLREEGMRTMLAERGLEPVVFNPAKGSLEEWLGAMPKPAAVMAASDDIASRVLVLCHKLKITLPSQLVLIGHDNDALICDNCRPRLSSVQIGHEEEGFAAAQMLSRMMRRPDRPVRDVLIAPKGVVVRETTRPVSPAARMIDRALVYIRENAASGIDVDNVSRHLNVSRRLLYLRFRELLGKTVLDVIAERRIELLKTRLSSSKEPIAAVSLACGFMTANHAKRAFRAATGVTMREWRAAAASRKTRSLAAG